VSHVRPDLIIVPPPGFAELFGFVDRLETVHVQEPVSQRPVERLDVRIVGRRSGAREVHFDLVGISPEINDLPCKLRAIIAEYSCWLATQIHKAIENRSDVFAAKPGPNFNGQAFAGEFVHDRQ